MAGKGQVLLAAAAVRGLAGRRACRRPLARRPSHPGRCTSPPAPPPPLLCSIFANATLTGPDCPIGQVVLGIEAAAQPVGAVRPLRGVRFLCGTAAADSCRPAG